MAAMSGMPLRVMLVDDHEVVRDGIRALLQATDDIVVTAEAGSVREAIDEAERTRPDVVVMDVRLADGSGIEATREIRARRPQTAGPDADLVRRRRGALRLDHGRRRRLRAQADRGGELVRAIRAVGQGQSLLDPAVTKSVLDRLRKGKHLMQDEKLARLSPQEERILTLVADGLTNGEIGEELHLAEKTVKNYVSSILSKLEVARRAEAAAYLARHTTTRGPEPRPNHHERWGPLVPPSRGRRTHGASPSSFEALCIKWQGSRKEGSRCSEQRSRRRRSTSRGSLVGSSRRRAQVGSGSWRAYGSGGSGSSQGGTR